MFASSVFAEISSVTIRGQVESFVLEQDARQELAGVRIQIIEIDNEPAEAEVKAHTSLTAEDGTYELKFDKHIIEDIDEITTIKIEFSKVRYVSVTTTVGPITEDWAERDQDAVVTDGAYVLTHNTYMLPESHAPSGLVVTKFNVVPKYTIFREAKLERSPSPY